MQQTAVELIASIGPGGSEEPIYASPRGFDESNPPKVRKRVTKPAEESDAQTSRLTNPDG